MLDRQTLKDKLVPLVEAACADAALFADLAIPVMQEHMKGVKGPTEAEEAFDAWNSVVHEIIQYYHMLGFFVRN